MEFLAEAATLGATTVLIVQEIFKLKIVPLAFANKYPVPTNVMLSVIVAVLLAGLTGLEWKLANLTVLLQAIVLAAVGAAIAYNQLLEKVLKKYEGPGK
jgi:hypothetical protein